MGRAPCCSKVGLHRGPWTAREDKLLINYIQAHGEGNWRALPKKAGLLRCGKSCRLRWMNYLRPDIKRGNITPDEDDLIIRLHSLLGNRWSLIAGRLPGRTDNEIKNYWNSHLSKKVLKKNSSSTLIAGNKPKYMEESSGKNKGTSKMQKEAIEGKTTKIKIYLPKAVRVSPLSVNLKNVHDHAMVGSSSNDHHAKGGIGDGEALASNDDQDFDGVYDHNPSSFPDSLASSNDHDIMLDDIFQEYEELLKRDDNEPLDFSFVDSLLA